MSWLRRLVAGLSRRSPRFELVSVHVVFVVGKVAMGHISLRVLRSPLVNIISPCLCIFIYHLRDEYYARWWQEFRDIVSPHRHEQRQQITGWLHRQNSISRTWYVFQIVKKFPALWELGSFITDFTRARQLSVNIKQPPTIHPRDLLNNIFPPTPRYSDLVFS
jgi:hypothetical protein